MGRASRLKKERGIYYHFTSQHHLPIILNDGVLTTTESNIDLIKPHAGPDVVWLLDTPDPDKEGHGLDNQYVDKRQVRFTVKIIAIKWFDWEWTRRMDERTKNALIKSGGGKEKASHWYISLAPIKRKDWLAIDYNYNGTWEKFDF